MREALLYEKLPGSRVKCRTCQWRCAINPGKAGVCHMYENRAGVLYNLNYGLVSAANIDPIEKKPLFHFYPGTLVYSLGGGGAISTARTARTGKSLWCVKSFPRRKEIPPGKSCRKRETGAVRRHSLDLQRAFHVVRIHA